MFFPCPACLLLAAAIAKQKAAASLSEHLSLSPLALGADAVPLPRWGDRHGCKGFAALRMVGQEAPLELIAGARSHV